MEKTLINDIVEVSQPKQTIVGTKKKSSNFALKDFKRKVKEKNNFISNNVKTKVQDIDKVKVIEDCNQTEVIGHDDKLIGVEEEQPVSENHGMVLAKHVLYVSNPVVATPILNCKQHGMIGRNVVVPTQESVVSDVRNQELSGCYKVIAQRGELFKDVIKVGFVDDVVNDINNDMTVRKLKDIGEGTFGNVNLCVLSIGNEKVLRVMKKMKLKPRNKEKRIKEFATWNKYLPKLAEKHLLAPEFVLLRDDHLFEVMEVGVMCLRRYIWMLQHKHKEKDGCKKSLHFDCDGSLPVPTMLQWFSHIFSGVEHLHKQRLIHGDIKPANIIVTDQLVLKLSDWDSLREENPLDESKTGTHGFMALEVYERKSQLKSDIQSVGCCIAAISGLCHLCVKPVDKTDQQITDEMRDRNYILGELIINCHRLIPYGIGEMFVCATKHFAATRGTIYDLIRMNVKAMHFVRFQQQQQHQIETMMETE